MNYETWKNDLNFQDFWQRLITVISDKEWRYRFKVIWDDEMSPWDWLIEPVDSCIESGRYGPVAKWEVEWIEVDPTIEEKTEQIDYSEQIRDKFTSEEFEFSIIGNIIRINIPIQFLSSYYSSTLPIQPACGPGSWFVCPFWMTNDCFKECLSNSVNGQWVPCPTLSQFIPNPKLYWTGNQWIFRSIASLSQTCLQTENKCKDLQFGEIIRAFDSDDRLVEIAHHKCGHTFPDDTYKLPHYHGKPQSIHITYPPGQ